MDYIICLCTITFAELIQTHMWFKRFFRRREKIDPSMKYLIAGLGNIGADYAGTRHNIGFDIVDHLAEQKEAKWKSATQGSITSIKHRGRTLILLKPSTYMNLSGKSVRYWLQKEKIRPENLLVIVDDLNLDFGRMRLRGKGSDGGHNGLKDINQMIGQKYARLRVGIGNSFSRGGQVDFVLGKWSDEEKKELPDLIKRGGEIALSFAAIGLSHTMTKFNK